MTRIVASYNLTDWQQNAERVAPKLGKLDVTAHPLINCNCSPPNKELSDVALTIKLASEQYGLGVKAFVLNLLVAQMVSFSRAQTLLKNLIDLQKG